MSLPYRSRPAAAVAVALALLLAGCGSTVQVESTVAAGTTADGLSTVGDPLAPTGAGPAAEPGAVPPAGDGLEETTGQLPGAAPRGGSAATTAGQGDGQSVGGPGGSSDVTGGGAPGPGAPAAAPTGGGAATGRGFTRSVVRLGVGTASDASAFAGTFGLEGATPQGNPEDWLRAAADEVNRRGGLAGRKIELVVHDFNTAQLLNDPPAAFQAACATWTEDKPVFAVLLAGLTSDRTLLECLKKVGTPLIKPSAGADYPLNYQSSYAQYPLFFNLAQMVGDRYDRISVRRLKDRGFFSPWDTRAGRPGTAAANPVKVGLVGFDDIDGGIQLKSQRAELARNGLRDVFDIACPRPVGEKIRCQQSAVLRFAGNGVTHVFGADTIFMNQATTQNYFPRQFIAVSPRLFAANAPRQQLRGAMGQGYIPLSDVEPEDSPGDPTPASATCKALMKKAGYAVSDATSLGLQLAVCDEFFFTKAAIDAVGVLSPSALRTGLERLGSSVPSALTWGTFLGPREHASATVLRDLEYREQSGRFVYTSTTNHGDR